MMVDDIVFFLTITSTTVSTIFAIVQLYLKIKQALKDEIKEIVDLELQNLKIQIEELKISQNELKKEIEEVKKKLS